MLDPSDRILLPDAIRPEPGYHLDHALVSTYSLDLTALLAVPLALTFFDWDEEGGKPRVDPIALLESLRSHAGRMTVLCQAGAIGVPKAQRSLLAFLERAVRGVTAPSGSFHPKLWVLRYSTDDAELDPIFYRVICASRNLTYDRSWDVMVVLDGTSTGRRRRSKPSSELSSFITDLVDLAQATPLGLDEERVTKLNEIAEDVAFVDFEPPENFDSVRFYPLGFGAPPDPLAGQRDRILTISPFLTEGTVRSLVAKNATLISRQEELDALPADATQDFDEVFVLDELANPEEEDDGDADTEAPRAQDDARRSRDSLADSVDGLLRGLHAKIYVIDAGSRARLIAGSANATHSGLSENVEFLVELEGRRRKIGVERILGNEKEGLRKVLSKFVRTPEFERDAGLEAAERLAEDVARALGATAFELHIAELASGDATSGYEVELRAPSGLPSELQDVDAYVWPITLNADRATRLSKGLDECRWGPLEKAQLVGFIGCRITARRGSAEVERAVTLTASLVGVPADRDAAITQKVLDSPERLLRYLAFLLADPERDPASAMEIADLLVKEPGWSPPPEPVPLFDDFPIFESLVRALDRDPARIDRVARLVADLHTTSDGKSLLPDGFEEIWAPILEARNTLKESSP